MKNLNKQFSDKKLLFIILITFIQLQAHVPLFFWYNGRFYNFGDHLSKMLINKIINKKTKICTQNYSGKKLLAIGSILTKAKDNDVIWGTGIKRLTKNDYNFTSLDIRAVRGPLTRQFIIENFNIACPEIYGDPALLIPYLFTEFRKSENPSYEFLIIPHYSEKQLFPKSKYSNVVYPTEPWDKIIKKILNSKFVISSSLHGIIVAEAFGIPARMLRITEQEPLLKYQDYYLGTGRSHFKYATSIKQALKMGGEKRIKCDLKALYQAFPFDFWPDVKIKEINFNEY